MTSNARRAACAIVALACAAPAAARAQDSGAELPAAPADAVTLVLRLEEGTTLDATGLRDAIARELGVSLITGSAPGGTLVVRQDGGDVAVTFDPPSGRRQSRTLALPEDPDQAVRDVALLAANLVRDQASEFIRIEAPQRAPSAAKPAPKDRAPAAQNPCDDAADVPLVGFDFAPLVGSSTVAGGRGPRRFSLGLVGTLSGGVRGVALGSALTLDTTYVCGAQIAGALNVTAGPLSGAQIAGGANVAAGGSHGLQAAGGVNVAAGPTSGLQVAGGANVVAGTVGGAQIAGALNVAGDLHGGQLSGAANVARSVSGAQITGGVNVAAGVDGAQIGTVNVAAGKVHGVQIGVVNVALDSDFSLGLLNVIAHGRFHVDAWGLPDSGLLLAGVKNGGPHYHYIYAVGLRPGDAHRAWAAFGLGAHVTPLESLFVDVDAVAHGELLFDSGDRNDLYQLRAVVGYRFFRGLAVFAGPTANVLMSGRDAPSGVAPGYATTLTETGSLRFRFWPGAAVGLEVL
jgi:hypothetical protein